MPKTASAARKCAATGSSTASPGRACGRARSSGFRLQNEDIKPLEYRVVANGDGAWRNFYVPFVWHLEGGTVQVELASESCSLNLSFAWARRRL